jgi:hypothetical protein
VFHALLDDAARLRLVCFLLHFDVDQLAAFVVLSVPRVQMRTRMAQRLYR